MYKIKSIIFDLDGVLVETKDLHFKALNKSLIDCKTNTQITYDEHIKIFDGLPTDEKLNILNKSKRLDPKKNSKVKKIKQIYTEKLLKNEIKYNNKIYNLFEKLSKKYSLAIATNAVRPTLNICIKLKIKILTHTISNEEIENPTSSEIYMRTMLALNSAPKETLIVEDSYAVDTQPRFRSLFISS